MTDLTTDPREHQISELRRRAQKFIGDAAGQAGGFWHDYGFALGGEMAELGFDRDLIQAVAAELLDDEEWTTGVDAGCRDLG